MKQKKSDARTEVWGRELLKSMAELDNRITALEYDRSLEPERRAQQIRAVGMFGDLYARASVGQKV